MAVEQKITSFVVRAGYVATETNLVKTSALQGLTFICADRMFYQFLIKLNYCTEHPLTVSAQKERKRCES